MRRLPLRPRPSWSATSDATAPKGTITGRVVLAGARDKGVAWAKVQIAAVNMMSIPFAVTADAQGRFQAERSSTLSSCAPRALTANWGRLSKLGPKTPRSRLPSARRQQPPAACSTKTARPRESRAFLGPARFYRRGTGDLDDVFHPEGRDRANGQFTLPALVVGQEYEISVQRTTFTMPPVPSGPRWPVPSTWERCGPAYRPKSPRTRKMSSFHKDAPCAAGSPRRSTQRHSTAAR